jgi:8-oxo-dGTP diphosphatase
MEVFKDYNGGIVRLSFQQGSFLEEPRHVLVICRYGESWLLTDHRNRGWEFPGGKCEAGESIEEAARREVQEETGALLVDLQFIGEYKVEMDGLSFVKAIYWGHAAELEKKDSYMETNGPILFKGDLLEERMDSRFSFIMKDDVVKRSVEVIEGRLRRKPGGHKD